MFRIKFICLKDNLYMQENLRKFKRGFMREFECGFECGFDDTL